MSNFLTENKKKSLMNLLNVWMKANEEILRTILNRKLKISLSMLTDKPMGIETDIVKNSDFLAFPLTLSSGMLGNCYLVFSKKDLAVIIDLIIGGDGSSPMKEFDELHLSVLEEAISQIAGTLESIISDNLMRNINVRLGKPDQALKKKKKNWEMVCLNYDIQIEKIPGFKAEFLIPGDFCRELTTHISEITQQASGSGQGISSNSNSTLESQGGRAMYRKAAFPQLGESGGEKTNGKLDLIMDIPLELTVVLGKTGISLKELVELGPGSILELENLAGEPVELYINDRFVGCGEVIVIEENFGVRVIEAAKDATSQIQGGGRKK